MGIVPQIELHANDIVHADKRGKFCILMPEFRFNLLESIYRKLANELSLMIIAVIVEKEPYQQVRENKEKQGELSFNEKKYNEEVFRIAYRLLIERITNYLKEEKDKGILVIDEPTVKDAMNWKFIIREEIEKGKYADPTILIPVPLFTRSELSRIIQLADLVAYCIRRYYLAQNKEKERKPLSETDRKFKNFYEKYLKKKIRQKNGKIEGFGIKIWHYIGKNP